MNRSSADGPFRRTTALIAVGTPIGEVLEAIVEAVEAEDPSIVCSIYLVDEDGRALTLAAAPNLPAAYGEAVKIVAVGPDMGSCGTAAFRNERVIVEDIGADPLWRASGALARAAGLAACWSQPIRGPGGEVFGAFAIYHRHVCRPGEGDIAFIESAAQLAAIAIARNRADEDLARSEARSARIEQDASRNLKTFFEVSLDMLCIRDMDRRFVKANKSWETALGYTAEELEGVSMLTLIHPDDVPPSQGHMERMQVEDQVHGFINRYRHKDGGYRHLEWRARRVGELVFGAARDVTDRLAIETEMAAARQAAEAANRAKSEFLANMSHEIRTPLNGVIGVVAALAKTDLNPAQREMVSLIETSGVSLERLVSDVLDFSKIEAGRMEIELRVFDLRSEIDGVLEVFRIRAEEKGLGFPVELGDLTRGEVLGDSMRIRQVLANLLSNAIKFTSEGEVRVGVRLESPVQPDLPSTLVMEVQDTGVGFDPGVSDQLFQRFSQADTTITRRFGGTGLGLSITRGLVEAMGGEIEAQSEPGGGSLFRVVLPLERNCSLADYDAGRRAPRTGGVAAAADPGAGRLQGLRVLLAEDHPINRRVVHLILEPFGVQLTTVENGAEAVEAFEAGDFDLVLMDMQMPVLDGLAATRAIRRHERGRPAGERTPVVMLSANAMRQHRLDAESAGADLHVAKPVTATALIAAVLEALAAGDCPLEAGAKTG